MNRPNENNDAQLEQTLRELFQEEVTMNDRSGNWWSRAVHRATEQPQRRGFLGMGWFAGLRPLPALAMTFALVFVIGGGLVTASAAGLFGSGGPAIGEDPELIARDAEPPLGLAGMCLDWNSWVADSNVFAFDGTVKSIEIRDVPNEFEPGYQEYLVTFDVDRWFRGGEGDEVSVWFNSLWLAESDMIMEPDDAELVRTGTRLLVSGAPRDAGASSDDLVAGTMCGMTKFHTPELADDWAEVFAG